MKYCGKIGNILKSDLTGNFADSLRGAQKQPFGLLYSVLVYILPQTHTGFAAKSLRKVIWRNKSNIRKLFPINIFPKMHPNVLFYHTNHIGII